MLISVSLAQILKVKPKKVSRFLVVSLGEEIKQGEIIAVKKTILGKKIEVKAEIGGFLHSLSEKTGELSIEVDPKAEEKTDKKESKQPAEEREKPKQERKTETPEKKPPKNSGEETSTKAKVSKHKVKGIAGFGSSTGELVVCQQCLEFPEIKKEYKGKVVFAPSVGSSASVFKASAMELAGLVIMAANKDIAGDVERLSGRSKFGFLILSHKEDKEVEEKLKKWQGKTVRVEGKKKELRILS